MLSKYGVRSFLIVCIFILICISTSSGLIVDTVNIDPEPSVWLTAGSSESALITINALNGTNIPVNFSSVTFTVEDPEMGTVIPSHTTTDAAGRASATFYPKTKSGIAWIRIEVNNSAPDVGSTIERYEQNIDHAGPKYILIPQAISPASVYENSTITVQFKDRFGNILDDNNTLEQFSVKFDASGSEGYFDGNPSIHVITKETSVNPTTHHEEAIVRFHLPPLAGHNYLRISETTSMEVYPDSTFFVIEGIGTVPDHIDSKIEDNDWDTLEPYQTYADPFHFFKIIYTVRDRFGNAVPNIILQWETNASDDGMFMTNYAGTVYLEYAKDFPQTVKINASIPGYSISKQDIVEFLQPEAVDFVVNGIPQLMASRDVEGRENVSGIVTVKVYDYFGQPKADETVTVYIDYSSMQNSTYLTKLPMLTGNVTSPIVVTTDENGVATVQFYPGAFPTEKDNGYDESASGSVYVRAKWDDRSERSVQMSYKNYPYLKAVASIDSDRCVVNETLNYTLTLLGDGYMSGGPADVVLLENRAGTMLKERDTRNHAYEDRMWAAQNASMSFVGELSDGVDRVAIISYGDLALPVANLSNTIGQSGNKMRDQYYLTGKDNDKLADLSRYPGNGIVQYDDFAHLDLELTKNHEVINDTIMEITPMDSYNELRDNITLYTSRCVGDQNPANSLRYGLYKSITYLRKDRDSSNLRFVVGLMDDEWTWFGDPTAQGSLMQSPCGANPGTGPYWPFTNPDKKYSNLFSLAMADWHQADSYDFTGNWDFTDGKNTWQNMSKYAKDNNIILFMVRYSAHQDAETQRTLNSLTLPTGGESFYAATPEELIEALQIIAHKIHGMASVNTSVNLDFNKINVSYGDLGGEEEKDGWDVFNYTYVENKSTHIEKVNETLVSYPEFPQNQDDTNNWTTNHTFSWNVGNMSINDNWTVHFSMEVLVPGNIVLFGTASNIVADNPDDNLGPQLITPPQTWISCYQNWTIPETRMEIIDILNDTPYTPVITPNSSQPGLDITWNLTYTNYTGNRIIKQEVFYQFSTNKAWTNDWIKFDTLVNDASKGNINGTYHSYLDTTKYEGYVQIMIFAYEDVEAGASDMEFVTSDEIINLGKILIE
jgi:hypothetical protein